MPSKPVTFSWKNYAKPTPKNLKLFMEFWHGLITFITVNNFIQGTNGWTGATVAVAGYAIGRLAKFFANVESEEAKANVTVTFPADMSDKVTVTETSEKVTKD